MGIVSGTSQHPKDVPFVREFWWGKYGLGCYEPPKKPNFSHRCRLLPACHSQFDVTCKVAACQGSYRPWKVPESPGIKILRFPGLESPGKGHRSWKTLEKSWNFKVMVLEILISGTSIAN